MLLICSLLIALTIAITTVLERNSTVEQEELIPIPVRASDSKNLHKIN